MRVVPVKAIIEVEHFFLVLIETLHPALSIRLSSWKWNRKGKKRCEYNNMDHISSNIEEIEENVLITKERKEKRN